jgi:Transposase/Transposase IS116/IS110/IS902 family
MTRRWFVGVDVGNRTHALCAMDANGAIVGRYAAAHTVVSCGEVFTKVIEQTGAVPGEIAVAIEVPRGAVVDVFLERGCAVFAINPKQLDRFRDRYRAASPKDDQRDAWVLADALRTTESAFRRVTADAPWIITLRELSRLSDELEGDLLRFTNRLREQLYRVAPALLALCPGADAAWLWTLLEQAPTQAARLQLAPEAIAQLLKQHRVRRLAGADVAAALRAEAFPLADGVVDATDRHLAALLPQIRAAYSARQACRADLKRALEDGERAEEQTEHRDVAILRSLPGVGILTAATMLAEAWQPLCARDYHRLRATSGVAPVTKQSGKMRTVRMRRACHRRLRRALHHWARTSIVIDPGASRYYRSLRSRGIPHGSAQRRVGDRWLRILVAMLAAQTTYDIERYKLAA